jgi:hypothetical protein
MKTKFMSSKIGVLALASLFASTSLTQAATIIFSDDFSTGINPYTQNLWDAPQGGTGFTSGWYSAGNGSGGVFNPSGVAQGNVTSKRDFSALGDTLGAGQLLLLRFDMQIDVDTSANAPINDWATFSFFNGVNGGTEVLALNNPWNSGTWGAGGTGVSVTVNRSVINYQAAMQSAYVEILLGVGATDSLKMWINTTQGGGYDPFSTPDVVASGFNLDGAGTIRMGGDAETDVDNISLTIIPEPSSALLGGLGALAMLRRRRR